MAERRIYLDGAGSFPIHAAVAEAVKTVPFANPSSPHQEGRAARAALDRARDQAARSLAAEPAEIVFCADGTEAANLAVLGATRRLAPGRRLVTWAVEHQAVLGAARRLELEGYPVTILPVDGAGRADPEAIPEDAGLVSVGLANNELGTLQPVAGVAGRARALGALVHVDAGQGPPWLDLTEIDADLVSLSGHKLGAGRGGLLRAKRDVRLEPLAYGGPQERSRRAGREDVAAATAVAVALECCSQRRIERSAAAAPLAERLRLVLQELGGRLTGAEARLPNFASAVFGDRRGEDMVVALDLAGVAASSGSACASGSLDPSHVLLAAGFSLAEAVGSLRLTVTYDTTAADVQAAESILRRVLGKAAAHA